MLNQLGCDQHEIERHRGLEAFNKAAARPKTKLLKLKDRLVARKL